MSTPYRFIPEEAKRWKDKHGQPIAVVEVTIRTILGIYLLKPKQVAPKQVAPDFKGD